MQPIISPEELQREAHSGKYIIIDATSGPTAEQQYLNLHLAGAQFVSLETDLANVGDPRVGGRHPLPTVSDFSDTLSRLGIHADSHVLVYDRMQGANATARFWWMAVAAGIKHTQVLSGGFDGAQAQGYPMNQGAEPTPAASNYRFEQWQSPTVSLHEVDELTADPKALIIDVREEARYQGKTEPIDSVAGHIPSAVNIPFQQNLNKDGSFKDGDALRELYAPYINKAELQKTVVHCGSGVTACHSILALVQAGYDMPALYVGSWSEWSRNDLPVHTTE